MRLKTGLKTGLVPLTEVLVLLVELAALGHEPLPRGRVRRELPRSQLVLRLFGLKEIFNPLANKSKWQIIEILQSSHLLLQGVALLGELLYDQVDRGVHQGVPQGGRARRLVQWCDGEMVQW